MTQWYIQRVDVFDQKRQEMVSIQTHISVTVGKHDIEKLMPLVTWLNETQGRASRQEDSNAAWYQLIFFKDERSYKFGKNGLRKDSTRLSEVTYEFHLYMNSAVYAQFVLAWGKEPIFNKGYLEY